MPSRGAFKDRRYPPPRAHHHFFCSHTVRRLTSHRALGPASAPTHPSRATLLYSIYPRELTRAYATYATTLCRGFKKMHYYHRPSRLIWFIIGAASATWWIKSKEAQDFQVRHCSRARIPQEAYSAPAPQDQQQPGQAQLQQGQAQTQGRHWHRRWEWSWPTPPPTGAGIAGGAPAGTPGTVSPSGEPRAPLPMPQSTENWDEERQRLQKLASQASETVSLSLALFEEVTRSMLKMTHSPARRPV